MEMVYNMIKNRFKEKGISSEIAERAINYIADLVDDGKRNRSSPKVKIDDVGDFEQPKKKKKSKKK